MSLSIGLYVQVNTDDDPWANRSRARMNEELAAYLAPQFPSKEQTFYPMIGTSMDAEDADTDLHGRRTYAFVCEMFGYGSDFGDAGFTMEALMTALTAFVYEQVAWRQGEITIRPFYSA